jgi:hypothetical protein
MTEIYSHFQWFTFLINNIINLINLVIIHQTIKNRTQKHRVNVSGLLKAS